MPSSEPPRNCGFHTVEKKKSFAGYILKKEMVSKTSDRTIPIVVRMATIDEATNRPLMKLSLTLRARIPGWMRRKARKPRMAATPTTTIVIARLPVLILLR